MWLSQFFMHPWMAAGGAALIAIPIIIHLLNRLRYRTVQFAAMEFLLQSEEENRRRVLLEQWLLLLLRILIVLFLVFLFARLLLDPSQLSLLEQTETHHVVVLDDSGSMQDRFGEKSAYQEAVETAKRLISELATNDGIHSLTLIRTSEPATTPANLTNRRIDDSLLGEFEDIAETLIQQPGYGTTRWDDVFSALQLQLAAHRDWPQFVHVLSDFRLEEWEQSPTLKQDLESLTDERTYVNLVPCVPESHANVALVDFSGDLQSAAVGVPLELNIAVKNLGETVVENLPVRVLIDGEPIAQAITIPRIEPGDQITESFDITLAQSGEHALAVKIPSDSLSIDNTRYETVFVPERQRVLIADGSEQNTEADYVADAIAADPQVTGFEAVIIRPESLREQDLSRFAVVYLLNIDRLPPDVVTQLESYVNAGGGLAWFMGDRIDSQFYGELAAKHDELASNPDTLEETVSENENGQPAETLQAGSLFPIRIASAPRQLPPRSEVDSTADLKLADHPIFRILNAADGLLAYYLNLYRVVPLAEDQKTIPPAVRVLGTLRDQSPVFLVTRYGAGQVFISLTSAGPISNTEETRWHNWPFDMNAPGFTVFHLDLVHTIANRSQLRKSRLVGDELKLTLNPADWQPEVRFAPPDQGGLTPITVTATRPQPKSDSPEDSATEQTPVLIAEYKNTQVPGIYRITRESRERESLTTLESFNVPVEESALKATTSAQLRLKLADAEHVIIQDFGRLDGLSQSDPGQELRTFLLVMLILFLMCEQALAYRLGYHNQDSMSLPGSSPLSRSFVSSRSRFPHDEERTKQTRQQEVAS
ncbi:MAG: BatA domain-containing protein [Planctomycetaceae bacterium]|nr:BatA domain-containing protein [Planctomycetaceae bacterium]